MKLLIRVKEFKTGETILVNPQRIVSIKEAKAHLSPFRLIVMDNGETFEVSTTVEQIEEEVTYNDNRL